MGRDRHQIFVLCTLNVIHFRKAQQWGYWCSESSRIRWQVLLFSSWSNSIHVVLSAELRILCLIRKPSFDSTPPENISCRNFDGGFGAVPGAESHAGQIFCCVAALSIGNALHLVDEDLLGWWLCERQCDSGGLNGRPEKQADVCYSWWILSSLSIMGRVRKSSPSASSERQYHSRNIAP